MLERAGQEDDGGVGGGLGWKEKKRRSALPQKTVMKVKKLTHDN